MWLKGFDNISYAALCTAALSPTDPHNTAVPDQAIRRARGLPSPHARLCGVRLRSSGGMQTLEAESLLNSSLMGSRAGMGSSWVRHDTQGFTYPAFTDGCGSDLHDYMRRGVGVVIDPIASFIYLRKFIRVWGEFVRKITTYHRFDVVYQTTDNDVSSKGDFSCYYEFQSHPCKAI